MRLSGSILFHLLAFLLLPVTLHGETFRIPGDVPNIQEAIAYSKSGDTILVDRGTYVENLNFLGKSIVVKSLAGPQSTVLDGSCPEDADQPSVALFLNHEGPGAKLEGFTLTGGGSAASTGGGLCCISSSPTIVNCIIAGNTALYGGGIYCGDHSSPHLEACTFENNEADSGAGIFCHLYSSPSLLACRFLGNRADYISGGFVGTVYSSPCLANCIFSENRAIMAAAVYVESFSSPKIVNSVFWGNFAESGGAVYCKWYAAPTLANSILWNVTQEEIYLRDGSPSVTFCNVQGGWEGTGNIHEPPLFVNPKRGDFHLRYDSPCIDTGGDIPGMPEEDFEGERRILDGDLDTIPVMDMGADEVQIDALQARRGNVNAKNGALFDVLTLNGSAGDAHRVYAASFQKAFHLFMDRPPACKAMRAPFALYAVQYEAGQKDIALQPYGIGPACFPLPLSKGINSFPPVTLVNNLAMPAFGHPILGYVPPAPVTVFFQRGLPRGTYTIQGIIVDLGALGPYLSLTNAIVLKVH